MSKETIKKKNKKAKCPRCKSIRLADRLNGERYCIRCGQRWARHGLLVPSFDRRKLLNNSDIDEEKQLLLTFR